MGLETGTYINSLVSTNPIATDGLSQADDHIRLVKATIKNTFPNITGALNGSEDFFNNGAVPVGTIVMWGLAISAIPSGWQLCDGTNGTPNLTGLFVRHADADTGGTVTRNSTGGSATDAITTSSNGAHTHTTSSNGAHDHGGSTGSHTLTVDQIPAHTHSLTNFVKGNSNGGMALAEDANTAGPSYTPVTDSTGGGLGHSHSLSSSGAHTHTTDSQGAHTHTATVDTVPPYIALPFIMRVADA